MELPGTFRAVFWLFHFGVMVVVREPVVKMVVVREPVVVVVMAVMREPLVAMAMTEPIGSARMNLIVLWPSVVLNDEHELQVGVAVEVKPIEQQTALWLVLVQRMTYASKALRELG